MIYLSRDPPDAGIECVGSCIQETLFMEENFLDYLKTIEICRTLNKTDTAFDIILKAIPVEEGKHLFDGNCIQMCPNRRTCRTPIALEAWIDITSPKMAGNHFRTKILYIGRLAFLSRRVFFSLTIFNSRWTTLPNTPQYSPSYKTLLSTRSLPRM